MVTGAKEIRVAIVSAVGVNRVVGLYVSMTKTWGWGGGGRGKGLVKLLKPQ